MSVRPTPTILILVAALFASWADPAPAQPTESEGRIDIAFGAEGISLEQAIEWARTSTGRTFQFKSQDFSNKPRIMMAGRISIPKERVYEFWQAIFVTQGFAMVPFGPGDGDFLMIESIDGARMLKQRANYVAVTELESVRNKVGEVIMTTIPLKHVSVNSVRGAVQTLLANRQAEFAQEVATANALIVVAFAPTVYAIHQILMAMDVPPPSATLKFEMITLQYAVAEELQPIIADLITSTTQGQQPGSPRIQRGPAGAAGGAEFEGQDIPEPKIIADPRTNALVVYAVESYMNEIKRLIAALDTEVRDIDSDIKVYFLKNTDATKIEQTLRDLLGQATGRSNRPVGGRPGAAGPTTVGESGRDVVIVADQNTNSLLIQASRTRYKELEPIIEQLDKRRPQVLVHAAIAELTEQDLQNIAVELTGVQGGDDRYKFAGGTGFGLSTITFDSAADTSDGILDSLARIPFATDSGIGFSGLAAGIFDDAFNVPLLVSMLKQDTKANLLSNASVLTNDNEESTIEVGNTINILRSETTAAGTDRVTAGDEVEANLRLTISPHISNDNYLRLNIDLVVEAFQGQGNAALGIPPPRTRRSFEGSVTVPNGKTVVIGGLVQDNNVDSVASVPFLGDIPILGELFKSTSTEVTKTTLYLFVTPTIIDNFQKLEEISYDRKLEIFKLNGNINLVDPNFRAAQIDDLSVDLEALERTGLLDMPSYSPVTPVGQAVPRRQVEGNPLRPAAGSFEDKAIIHEGGTLKFRGGEAIREGATPGENK